MFFKKKKDKIDLRADVRPIVSGDVKYFFFNPQLQYYSEYEAFMEEQYKQGKITKEEYDKIRRVSYGTDGSAGLDLPIWDDRLVNGEWSDNGEYTLQPMESKIFKTGVYMSIPKNCFGRLDNRSSTAKLHLSLLSNIIDDDFRGNIRLSIINLNTEPVTIKNGDYLFQIIIIPYVKVLPCLVNSPDALGETERGTGGFGSTNKKFQ